MTLDEEAILKRAAHARGGGDPDREPEPPLDRQWLDREIPRDAFGIGRELSSRDLREPGELGPE